MHDQSEPDVDPRASDQQSGRVLKFQARVRTSTRDSQRSPVEDLRKYARGGEDDYGHRMRMNAVAVAVVVVLVACGVWLVDTMAQMRKKQDCVLSGRRNCVQINVPVDAR